MVATLYLYVLLWTWLGPFSEFLLIILRLSPLACCFRFVLAYFSVLCDFVEDLVFTEKPPFS